MLAFYNAGGATLDTLLRLDNYFHHMSQLYRTVSPIDLVATFGDFFAYHLATRTTRRIDMSRVQTQPQCVERFVPNVPNWERNRRIRQRIREGHYIVNDEYDLLIVREALSDGLLPAGRYQRPN